MLLSVFYWDDCQLVAKYGPRFLWSHLPAERRCNLLTLTWLLLFYVSEILEDKIINTTPPVQTPQFNNSVLPRVEVTRQKVV